MLAILSNKVPLLLHFLTQLYPQVPRLNSAYSNPSQLVKFTDFFECSSTLFVDQLLQLLLSVTK